jgi:hypothetical protein
MKEPEWFTTTIHKGLHDLGDEMHGQETEFDPSRPLRPGRYWWGIDPNDPSHIICADRQTDLVMGTTVTDDTLWVTEIIRKGITLSRKNRQKLRRR